MSTAALTREAAHISRRSRKRQQHRLSVVYGTWPECLIGAPAGPDFDPAEYYPFTREQIVAGLVIPIFAPKERSAS